MSETSSSPLLFDTSAESWFARTQDTLAATWWRKYLQLHAVHVSAITVLERTRGYSMLWRAAAPDRRPFIESARLAYLDSPRIVHPVDTAASMVAGELMALVPDPPTPPKRTHRVAESKSERLARWRFDTIIAATAMVNGMTLVHNNPADFETIRSAVENSPQRFPTTGSLNLIRCQTLTI